MDTQTMNVDGLKVESMSNQAGVNSDIMESNDNVKARISLKASSKTEYQKCIWELGISTRLHTCDNDGRACESDCDLSLLGTF